MRILTVRYSVRGVGCAQAVGCGKARRLLKVECWGARRESTNRA